MPGVQLKLEDVVYIYVYIERMAKLMQRTRTNLTVATDTVLSVAAALHLPFEPKAQKLDKTQLERKEFYQAVIAARRSLDGYVSRGRIYMQTTVQQDDVTRMLSLFRYAVSHCEQGHPGPQKIYSRLISRGWQGDDLQNYPIWTPSGTFRLHSFAH